MSDITANVVVSMPSQLFTMARSFKAVANGKIYIGKIDTDPVNPENQIQVYIENEDGSHVPVSQPIIINAAGYPVYNGQIAKFVTVQGHSMAVYDAYGAQQFYFPNVLKYDPDQAYPRLIDDLKNIDGISMIGGGLYNDIREYAGNGMEINCTGGIEFNDGCSGLFILDERDNKSVDDGGTVLVDRLGRRWKRQFDGTAQRRWFGLPDNEGLTSGWDSYAPPQEKSLKDAVQDIAVTPDDVCVKHRAIKAFRKSVGIKDSAVAGAFIVGEFPEDSDVEPSASVTGFESYDDIGKYPGRDSVALFAQAESALPIEFSDGVFTTSSVMSYTVLSVIGKVQPGMILDVNFGTEEWVGTVITAVNNSTGELTISGWRKIDGSSSVAATPANNTPAVINKHNNLWAANFNALTTQNGGANQAIGIETGLSLLKTGSGTGSKAYYAVNLSSGVGEDPQYGFMNGGKFQKIFFAQLATDCSFESTVLASTTAKHCNFHATDGTSLFRVGYTGLEVQALAIEYMTSTGTVSEASAMTIATASNININLDVAARYPGRLRKVKNASSGDVTVNGVVNLTSGMYAEFISDGSSWIILFTK
ncbi:phage head-binding domain-containing protein [Escherichia coli]|uniref:phage head-binding domain-containing protein n=1 Tax=Escherichia coli TaxID=562 RepID=UPI001CBAA24C|nr:phage head-binding domain-containing protein [Escherichia coli]